MRRQREKESLHKQPRRMERVVGREAGKLFDKRSYPIRMEWLRKTCSRELQKKWTEVIIGFIIWEVFVLPY